MKDGRSKVQEQKELLDFLKQKKKLLKEREKSQSIKKLNFWFRS